MTNLSDFCAQLVAKISITNVTLSFNNVTENVRVGQLWTWLCINDRKAARTITLQTCMQFYSIITVAGKGGANAATTAYVLHGQKVSSVDAIICIAAQLTAQLTVPVYSHLQYTAYTER